MATYGTKLPFINTRIVKNEPALGDPLPSAEVQDILDRALAGDDTAYHASARALVQTFDPATGDSLLQMAAKSGNPLQNVKRVIDGFGRVKGRYYEWAHHALLVHQNHDGDTVMHVAARFGNLVLVTLLYRYFMNHWTCDVPEETGESYGSPELFRCPQDMDDSDSAASLALLLTKNLAGRNTVEEARMAGHQDVARWLEGIVSRLDRDGTRRLDANLAKLVEDTREERGHAWMEKRISERNENIL